MTFIFQEHDVNPTRQACSFGDQIEGFLKADKDVCDLNSIQAHLSQCPICRNKYVDLIDIASLLTRRERPKPARDTMREYRRQLKREWRPHSKWAAAWSTLRESFTVRHSLPLRLARIAALLIIGYFIGRMSFGPAIQHSDDKITQKIYLFPIAPQDRRIVSDYISESEGWLLAVVETATPQFEEIHIRKETARKLLFKTCSLEAVISPLNHEPLSGFLNQMEHVLLEISNTPESNLTDVFLEIQRTIRSTNLHEEPKRLQRMLHAAGQRGA